MDEQHGISSSLKIVGSFCLYMSIMVNELTEVIRVLSKIRVSEDNCSLFLTGYMSALYPHKKMKVTNYSSREISYLLER